MLLSSALTSPSELSCYLLFVSVLSACVYVRKNTKHEVPTLQRIPWHRLSQRQKALLPLNFSESWPVYKFLGEPTALGEFDWGIHDEIVIWRENGTFIFIYKDYDKAYAKRRVFVILENVQGYNLHYMVYGEREAAIAETITFFGSLKHEASPQTVLRFHRCNHCSLSLDLSSLLPEQLAQMLDSNPTRCIDLEADFSAKQSEILATRPYPLDLLLMKGEHTFLDGGTAFVEALELRKSPFGKLIVSETSNGGMLSISNLERLLKLEYVFQTLDLSIRNTVCALLPFNAKVKTLYYRVHQANDVHPESFDSLNIPAIDITPILVFEWSFAWHTRIISFLNRVAVLGHFERLCIGVDYGSQNRERFLFDEVASVADALTAALRANQRLSCLELHQTRTCLLWGPHLRGIFECAEEHPSLREIRVQSFKLRDGSDGAEDENRVFSRRYYFDRSWLKRLLSRNRKIVVLNEFGERCSDGSTIDQLYALNDVYNGSANLVKEATDLRPLLVTKAFTERASNNFQYTALLLSQHTDVLCELVQGVDQEDGAPRRSNRLLRSKRKTEDSSRARKKSRK